MIFSSMSFFYDLGGLEMEGSAELKKIREGETVLCNNGLVATLVHYNNCLDCVIRFEDGVERTGVSYVQFKRGALQHPTIKTVRKVKGSNKYVAEGGYSYLENRKKYLGVTKNNKRGIPMTLVEYFSSRNITVEFPSGIRVYNRDLKNFLNGSIACPDSFYIGKTTVNKDNEKLVITKQLGRGISKVTFKDGSVANVSKNIARKMLYMAEFEDGTEVICNIDNFTAGRVVRPNSSKHEGEVIVNYQGVRMTLEKYVSCNEVYARLENGILLKSTYYQFTHGKVRVSNHKGEKVKAINGVVAKIIDCEDPKNMTVKFEDGTIIRNVKYSDFRKRCLKHPTMRNKFGSFKIEKVAYKLDNTGDKFYFCKCEGCSYKDILTPQEMLSHKCKENKNG